MSSYKQVSRHALLFPGPDKTRISRIADNFLSRVFLSARHFFRRRGQRNVNFQIGDHRLVNAARLCDL